MGNKTSKPKQNKFLKSIYNCPQDEFKELINQTINKNRPTFLNAVQMQDGGTYTGEWKNGMRDGYGKHIFQNYDIQEGDFKNDEFSGTGIYFKQCRDYKSANLNEEFKQIHQLNFSFQKILQQIQQEEIQQVQQKIYPYIEFYQQIYIGQLQSNKYNGFGLLIQEQYIYRGNFKNHQKNGYGEIFYNDKTIYKGEFVEDLKQGMGLLTFNDGSFYIGTFFQDQIQGFGSIYWANCNYSGQWKQNKMHGEGIWKINGQIYEGEMKDGKR